MGNFALTVVLGFIASLGVAVAACGELAYRLEQRAIQERAKRAWSAAPPRRMHASGTRLIAGLNRTADRIVDLFVRDEIWPRQISGIRLIGNGITSAMAAGTLCAAGLQLPWWMTAPVSIGALIFVPVSLASAEQRRLCALFEGMLADTIDMMVRMLRAGLPVTVAVRRVGREAQEPAAAIYREADQWLQIGLPLAQAMRTVAVRIKVKDFDFFAAALAIQSNVGGNLTETLESLSKIIRERSVSILKARAVTAQARLTANVILGILPGLAIMLQLIRPQYILPLVDGSHGYALITFVLLSYLAAFVIIRQLISRVKIV